MASNRKFKREYIILEAKDINFKYKERILPKAFAKIEVSDEKSSLALYVENLKSMKDGYRVLIIRSDYETIDLGKINLSDQGKGEFSFNLDSENSEIKGVALLYDKTVPLIGFKGSKIDNHEEILFMGDESEYEEVEYIEVDEDDDREYEYEEVSSNIQKELDKIDKGLNMAMYFARLNQFEKDFSAQKVNLYNEVVKLINKEKRLFIKNRIIPKVELEKDLVVYSDKKWLRFIIEQIIINGVKYSKNYGKYLNIKNRENGKYIIIDIIDEGVGISKKDIKRVFEPFFTGENGRNFGESTGMGLYIVKTVCDNLGHKVEIKSEIEKGTQVSILFIFNNQIV